MAVIPVLPALDIIDGFRHTLDYYCHNGLICVRKWPRSPGHHRSPAVEAQWPAFSYVNKSVHLLSPSLRLAFRQMAQGSRLTWKDLLVRSYIQGLKYYE